MARIPIMLALLGIADCVYLWYLDKTKKRGFLCTGDTCTRVTQSKYSAMLGIRNEIAGLLYYSLVLIFAGLLGFHPLIPLGLQILTGIGFLVSLLSVYVQLRVLRAYCWYCMGSAVISTLLFIASFFL